MRCRNCMTEVEDGTLFCPECGAKIIIHKSCEFCRWHLRDTTCFNDLEKRPRTTPEDSCWNWEERE